MLLLLLLKSLETHVKRIRCTNGMKVKYPYLPSKLMNNVKKDNATAPFDTLAYAHTLYFVQRSAKHHIVYKSQITPNLAYVRLTLLCINMLFRMCLLVVTTSNVCLLVVMLASHTRAHTFT